MKSQDARNPVFIYVLILLGGILLAYVGRDLHDEFYRYLIIGIGASVAAVGLTGVIGLWLLPRDIAEQIERFIVERVGAPATFTRTRAFQAPFYLKRSEKSKKIDIISLTLEMIVIHYNASDVTRWIMEEGKHLRILVLHPKGLGAKLRGDEERQNFEERINIQISRFRDLLYTPLAEEHDEKKGAEYKGSLEVKCYDSCPYFAYFRADQDIVLGLYYSHLLGNQSECLHLHDVQNPVYNKLLEHFEFLWGRGHSIFKVAKSGPSDNSQLLAALPTRLSDPSHREHGRILRVN